MHFCTNCGAPWPAAARFCGECGSPAAPTAPAAPAAPAAAAAPAPADVSDSADGHDYEYVLVDSPSSLDLDRVRAWFAGLGTTRSALLATASVTAVAMLATIAVAVLGVLLVALAVGDAGVPADWIRTGVLLSLAGLGAVVTVRTPEVFGDGTETVHVTGAPVLLTVTFAALLYLGTRRFVLPRLRTTRPRDLAVVAVLAVAVTWALMTVLGLISGGGLSWEGEQETTTFEAFSWRGLVMAAPLVTLLAVTALTPVGSDAALSRWGAQLRRGLRFAAELLAAAVVAAFVVAVGMLVVIGSEIELDLMDLGSASLASTVFLPNVAVVFAGVITGGTMASTEDAGTSTIGVFAGDLPPLAYAGLAVMLLLAVAVGVRHALRRSPGTSLVEGLWVAPLVYALLWIYVAVLTTITASDGGEEYSFGLSLVGLTLCALVWAALGEVLGRLLGRSAAGWYPATTARLTGRRRIDAGWAVLIAERLRRDGRKVPRHLAEAERTHVAEPGDRLRRGHGTLAVGALGAALASTLLLVPTATADFCGLPYAAQLKDEKPTPAFEPSPEAQVELDRAEASVAKAEDAVKKAKRAAGPGAGLQATYVQALADLTAAEDELRRVEEAASSAERRVNRLADVGEWEREWLEYAQDDLELMADYNDDGYWSDQVEEAEDDLYEAEAPLRRAQADRDRATAALPQAEQEAAAARAAVDAADAAYRPYEPKLAALDDTRRELREAEFDLQQVDGDWRDEANAVRIEAASYNDLVAVCHDEALRRTVPAGGLLAGLVVLGSLWLVRRRRRPTTALTV